MREQELIKRIEEKRERDLAYLRYRASKRQYKSATDILLEQDQQLLADLVEYLKENKHNG